MEQQIRNEKFREIELKKSMFNVKMFSLMKKQLFSLVMMLALVVLAGTSARAQFGVGTIDAAVTHVTGSTHTYTVSTDGGGTYAWSILTDVGGTAATASHYSIVSGQNAASFVFTWTDEASGSYIVRVVDTGATGCSTTRDFYVDVFTFDVLAFVATDNTGATAETDFSQCGDNHDDPLYIADNELAAMPLVTPATADGTLQSEQGTIGTTRYIGLDIEFDAGLSADPTFNSIGFDYTITATYTDGSTVATGDIQTFNGQAGASGTTWFNTASNTFALPIIWNDRWGAANNIEFSVQVTNFTLYSLAGGPSTPLQVKLGEELEANEAAQGSADPRANTSQDVTIEAAPATSVITVN